MIAFVIRVIMSDLWQALLLTIYLAVITASWVQYAHEKDFAIIGVKTGVEMCIGGVSEK